VPLADADSSGNPQTHPWNYGFYWILDQMLYREPGELGTAASLSKDGKSVAATKGSKQIVGKPSKQGLGWFGRIAFEPQDRNFVGFYFESGLVYTGLIPTRDEDQLGVGFTYAQLTDGARKTLELEGSRGVGAEMVLEFTYKAILTPWLYIQPDAQFIINPGATQDLNNAFVIGMRVSLNF
jgi:porin